MRLYGAICKVTPNSDGTLRVEGIASSEAEDDQGETIRADAMRAAIPDYMKYPALREMHQLLAAGTTIEADVGNDGFTRIVARVVDPIAISKVKNEVYRGFSIGGRVTKRDPSNPRIITGIQLSEISLVDRPANPEAQLEVWKASITEGISDMAGLATLGDLAAGQQLAAAPVQIWHCGNDVHRHAGKAEAVRCIEKQAASGANGGTQWEPLAKGETEAEATPAGEPEVDSVIAENSGPVAEATEAESPPDATGGSAENPEEKTSGSDARHSEDETATEVGETGTVEDTDEHTVEEASEEAAGTVDTVDTVDTSKAGAEPSATEQAVAKAAEVAALARAALNLPEAQDEAAKAKEPDSDDRGGPSDADADDKASDDKPKGDYGSVEYADPGYQSDGKPRYPVDTTEHVRAAWSYINQEANHKGYTAEQVAKIKAKIVSAWKAKIDKAGPPSAGKATLPEIFGAAMLSKGWVDTADLIDTVGALDRLAAMLRWQAVHEGGEEIARAAGALPLAAESLRALVTAPELDITDEELTALATKSGGIPSWIEAVRARDFGELADVVEKAAGRHSAKNQMLIDKAYECAMQCASMDGCTKSMSDHLDAACKMMSAAGAHGYGQMSGYAAAEKSIVAGELAILAKAGGHQALLDMAHFCLASMGDYCTTSKGAAEETGIKAAHNHLCLAGATCSGGAAMKAVSTDGDDKLAKARTENETLRKSLGDVVSLVEQLVGKIDAVDEKVTRIDNQELPPRGLARTAGLGITKAQDNGTVNGIGNGAPTFNTVEDIVKAVEAMPPSMEKAFLHMRLAHSDPRPVKVISAAEAATGAAQ